MTAKRFQRYYTKAIIFWHLGMAEEEKKEKHCGRITEEKMYLGKKGRIFMPEQSV